MANHNPPTNGLDKRPAAIWRKGRSKSFDAYREFVQSILNEPAVTGGENKKPKLVLIQVPKLVKGQPVMDEDGNLVMEDHYATNLEMVIRSQLKDPKRQPMLKEDAYGKTPQPVEVAGKDGGAIETKVIDDTRFDRAILTLVDALRKSVPGESTDKNG